MVSQSFVCFSRLPLSRNIAADLKEALALPGRVRTTHMIYLPLFGKRQANL